MPSHRTLECCKDTCSLEQREGRIDRYLSHLMRKRIALLCDGGSFEERLYSAVSKHEELEKKCGGKKPLFPFWYVGVNEYKFFHNDNEPGEADWPKFIRVICALPNSRESIYYAKLRAALKKYNYYIGPTYQGQQKTSCNFCPLFNENHV